MPINGPLTNFLSYNGIVLEVCKINHFLQHPVMSEDGADLLYVHYDISVDAVFNPKSTASGRAAPGAPGNLPAKTIVDFRESLTSPRGTLIFSIGNTVVLKSPLPLKDATGKEVNPIADSNNGPIVLQCDPIVFKGVKTALVRFRIETWLSACPTLSGAMISHRWSMQDDIDELFYTTRTIAGTVVFLRDVMDVAQKTPDDFRNVFFHPCPDNFKPIKATVREESNGLVIHYTIVFEEQPINLGLSNPIKKIKGTYSKGYDFTGGWLPTLRQDMTVECWGSRTTTRQQCADACFKAAAAYGLNPNAFTVWWYKRQITVDIFNKYARLDIGTIVHPKGEGWNLLSSAVAGAAPVQTFPESIIGDGTTIAFAGTGPNPQFPGSPLAGNANYGSRGTSLTRLITQYLLTQCGRTLKTPGPSSAFDLTTALPPSSRQLNKSN